MGSFALVDATTHVGGYDFTTDMNQVSITFQSEELDNTTFGGGGFRSRVGGLKDIEAQLGGYWQSGLVAVDPTTFNSLGLADDPVSLGPTNVEGSIAYMWRGEKFNYSILGDDGQLAPFAIGMKGSNGQTAVRGQWTKARGNVSTAATTGTALNMGVVGVGQFLYATLHVFSVGTTITAVIESDDNAGFTTPTTRITFGPITTVGGVWGTRVAGSLTDTWYRLRISAITGTFNISCTMGIGV